MAEDKTIQQQIDEIIERQYNGYRGRFNERFKKVNDLLWRAVGDRMFLAYLEKQEKDNPRPIYTPSINK